MDVLLGLVIVLVPIFIWAAIDDARSKKRFEREYAEKLELEKQKREEYQRQQQEREEQERIEEEKKQAYQRELAERRLALARKNEEEKREQQRILDEKLKNAKENNPALYFQLKLPTYNISTIYADGILGIEANLPSKNMIRGGFEKDYLKADGTVKVQLDKDLPKLFEKSLYTTCLNTIHDAFVADDTKIVQSIVYNGFVQDYSPTTGNMERNLVLSLMVDKSNFLGIDLNHVDPKKCFKALKGVSAAKLIDLVPVQPVLQFDKNDHRFIENKNVSISSGTNLASMPWEDFEQLVRDIFEMEFSKNGSEVRVTQASRDGGVDAIVFDPDPLRGGKVVIQAKRYTNTVPVSAIRDLYGTVINEGANSGIIITTSDYGRDSYDFAKDKPLKLLNGGHLLALLTKNGRKGYINLEEAKESLNGEHNSL
ncbi:MAG: restriction endonuclease [Bacteroidales bacterium]|nr:restriction endonuclease [Bacteroidales bacterium]